MYSVVHTAMYIWGMGVILASFPGPRAHFTFAACGPGTISHMYDSRRVERVKFHTGEQFSDNEGRLLFGAHLYHRLSAETMSLANGREVQLSIDWSLPTHN